MEPIPSGQKLALVNDAAFSKVNWAAGLTFVATLAAVFGIDLSPETQVAVLKGIGLVSPIVIAILRTWFTAKPIPLAQANKIMSAGIPEAKIT